MSEVGPKRGWNTSTMRTKLAKKLSATKNRGMTKTRISKALKRIPAPRLAFAVECSPAGSNHSATF
jgi:hypothetical protein